MHLAEGFVEDNAGRGGQVETADFAGRHGDQKPAFGVTGQEFGRQAARFAAEDEAIAVAKPGLCVGKLGPGAQAMAGSLAYAGWPQL